MANEIVKLVAQKANISEPIAQIAVNTVLNFLKGKLPPAVGSSLDSLLGSGSGAQNNSLGDMGNIADTLGSLLGKKQ